MMLLPGSCSVASRSPFSIRFRRVPRLVSLFEFEALRAKLLFLPDQLVADVIRKLDKGRVDFVKAQVPQGGGRERQLFAY